MGIFDGIFNNKPQEQAAADQTRAAQNAYNLLSQNFSSGRDALTTNFTAGLQPFLQNYSNTQPGTSMLNNALGLNGPTGSATAQAAFLSANPQYAFTLDQGQKSVLANAEASGLGKSGNMLLDSLKFGQGLASGTFQNWINNLQPFLSAATSNAAGIAQGYQGLGTALNNSYTGQGNAGYGAVTSIGNAQANSDLSQIGVNSNILGALKGLGGLIMQGLPTGGGGGNPFDVNNGYVPNINGGGVMPSGAGSSGGGFNIGSAISSLLPFLMSSDERVKDNIQQVGKLNDGQPIYRFNYKGDPRTVIGLIAQEVARTRPEAVGNMGDGTLGVDYNKATNYAASLSDFMHPRAAENSRDAAAITTSRSVLHPGALGVDTWRRERGMTDMLNAGNRSLIMDDDRHMFPDAYPRPQSMHAPQLDQIPAPAQVTTYDPFNTRTYGKDQSRVPSGVQLPPFVPETRASAPAMSERRSAIETPDWMLKLAA